MAKVPSSHSKPATRTKTATQAGPASSPPAVAHGDAEALLVRDTQDTAARMPFNPNKATEYGVAAGVPPEGAHVVPTSRAVTGSTRTEHSPNLKTDGAAVAGHNAVGGSLERVRMDSAGQRLTTNQGVPLADNQASLNAGLRGPALLKDFVLREKITHFDHERIPERIVHARGSAAHGFFEAYESMETLTRAAPLSAAGKVTPVFVRFSTVAGERGSKDTARDVRGFAVKFYTDEGNWDLVGNNMPVFFIQDAMKFPDLVHAVKPEPHNGMPQAASAHDTFWDFVSLMPESTHMLLWAMSDRGIPRSYRMMQGFGVHTFRFVTQDGKSSLVKFHWTPLLGTHSHVWEEAVKISGCDPDYHRRDLWDAIEAGHFPEWELGVQVFSEEDAEAFSFDVLDATKLVPEELVPITPVGRMVLNRNPDNFFAETEQVAFCTAHVIPGIDFTNDPLLAGRIHSYVDTQISRLGGPNFHEIPINAPLAPVHNNQRDGLHRQAVARGRVAYEPNSLGGGCPYQTGAAGFVPFAQPVTGDELRAKPEKFAEHYTQARLFFESQTPREQAHIIAAFRFELSKVTVPAIRERTVAMLRNVSDALALPVASGLGLVLPQPLPNALAKTPKPEVLVSPGLSLHARPGDGGVQSRTVGIVVCNGVDGAAVEALSAALEAAGARPRLWGPRVGGFSTAAGEPVMAAASFENEPAVLFDALVLPGGNGDFETLGVYPMLMESIWDQYRHGKTLLALGTGMALLAKAGVPAGGNDPGVLTYAVSSVQAPQEFIAAVGKHRHPDREVNTGVMPGVDALGQPREQKPPLLHNGLTA